ncbi:MAG TPA: hypothetical protein VHI93_01635 [Candidatus Thermoplasmatota archaeon]|nr:hypothetical protein [Candidatus Thermoplasmatota archaeon]
MPAIAPFHAIGVDPRRPALREARPAFYLVEASGPHGLRRGLLAWMALEGAPAMPAGGAGPAVLRYEDPRGWVEELLASNAFEEVARFADAEGGQRVWRVDRPEAVGELVAQFDGRALALLRPPGPHPAGAVLAFLVRGDGWLPRWPGGPSLAVASSEPVPRPWSGEAGPAQWRPPPL